MERTEEDRGDICGDKRGEAGAELEALRTMRWRANHGWSMARN